MTTATLTPSSPSTRRHSKETTLSATYPNDDANTAPERIIESVNRELEGRNETWPVYRTNTLYNRRQDAINRIALRKQRGV